MDLQLNHSDPVRHRKRFCEIVSTRVGCNYQAVVGVMYFEVKSNIGQVHRSPIPHPE